MTIVQSIAKHRLVLAALFLSTILGFGLVYGMSGRNSDAATAKSDSCDGTCIALEKEAANPSSVAVPVGDYVQFNSADGNSHSLSQGGGGEEHSHSGQFTSGTFGADEAWRVQFNDEGTFKFHDHLNPKINVIVVVYTPGKDYKIE